MRMIIAIRGEVIDDVEAKDILTAVDTAIKPFTENIITVTTSLTVDVKLPETPP